MMVSGFRCGGMSLLNVESVLHPASRLALCLHMLFLWSFCWGFTTIVKGSQDPISQADRDAIENFNRQTEPFLFRGKVASSLLEVASRDYPPIDLPPDPKGRSIQGIVVNDQGEPVPDTTVLLLMAGLPGSDVELFVGVRDVLLKQSTGTDGRFDFSLPNLPPLNQDWFRVLAVHSTEGVAVQTLISEEFIPIPGLPQWNNVNLRLHPMSPFSGHVENRGNGLADAEVILRQITSSDVSKVLQWVEQTAKFGKYTSSDFSVRTDSQGNFQFESVPTVGCFVLLVRHSDFPTKLVALEFLDPTTDVIGGARFAVRAPENPPFDRNSPIHSIESPLSIELSHGSVIKGRSVIRGMVSQNGAPCPDAWLVTTSGDFARSDEFGKFAIPVSTNSSTNATAWVIQPFFSFRR